MFFYTLNRLTFKVMITIADEPRYLSSIRYNLHLLYLHTSRRSKFKVKSILIAREIRHVADSIRLLTWVNERDGVVIESITALIKEGYVKANQLKVDYEIISARAKHQVKIEPLKDSIQYLRDVITELKEEFNL